MPDAIDAVHLLALLTRVRAARIAGGEIAPSRLYDVRAFKSAYAELGYLRTLTRRPTGGTIVTSMPQLVKGLAAMLVVVREAAPARQIARVHQLHELGGRHLSR